MLLTADILFNPAVRPEEKRRLARLWLGEWQHERLPELRSVAPLVPPSVYKDSVTLLIYSFWANPSDFFAMEFSILQSWKVLGKLHTVIVTDRHTDETAFFAKSYEDWVDIQVETSLKPGDINSMSEDCIERLKDRFSTPYCLIIQDDGFPICDRLDEFLGKYDYIGAPTIRDVWQQHISDLTRCTCLNGGFSLRSKRICADVAQQWKFWRNLISRKSQFYPEDVIYSQICCHNPLFRLRNRFPTSRKARQFSILDFEGAVDLRGLQTPPMGVHGPTAIWQLQKFFNKDDT